MPPDLPARPRSTRSRFLAWALTGLLLAACSRAPVPLAGIDVTGADFGKDFRLTDPDGRERSLADFRGRYVMLFFGFTQCPDVCPGALARAAEVRRELGRDGERLQVIFVSVDPERDTAPLLREYTQAFDPSFLGLRGDLAATQQVAAEFRVFYQKVPTGGGYSVDHTALSYLFDPQGRLRLLWRPDLSAAQQAADLRALMRNES